MGTIGAIDLTREFIKAGTRRSRTGKFNTSTTSFPSGNVSHAFAADSLTSLNLRVTVMNDTLRTIRQYTGTGGAWGTAWARVEAGKHYPSDVLASAAVANFFHGIYSPGLYQHQKRS